MWKFVQMVMDEQREYYYSQKNFDGVEVLTNILGFYEHIIKKSQIQNPILRNQGEYIIPKTDKDKNMSLKMDNLKLRQYANDLIHFFEYSATLNLDILGEFAYVTNQHAKF